MKKIILMMLTVVMSLFGIAQDFETKMISNIQKLQQNEEKVDMLKLSTEFKTLAEANPKRYEARYYEALCLIFNSFEEKDKKQIDAQLDKAEKSIDVAMKLKSKEAELHLLKALSYQMRIDVDPQTRGHLYSQKAAKEMAIAFELDSKNPRYYFLQGQNLFYTPEQYGGGKELAKPFFEKAQKLFKKAKQKNKLDPMWGEQTNAYQLKACQK